ncbi:K(+)-transporting ATPase subunit F [Sinomicrobium weinanense]|uniref:K(+)-transporting ATPase subunit F n=1 Tax=Sinomicrobium weinanense TaxID=2842200 RepID=A0A926JTJ6_9FLAO|nr:K(+)-transporting ATPase subunit F [Sinomicrobium weinanense]MBU3122358.1 K(+)-transporting ATPase subunit F [Sinomicrobium weinanense]
MCPSIFPINFNNYKIMIVLLILAVVTLGYLFYAIVKPEKF